MDATIRIHYRGNRDDPHFTKCVDFIKSLGECYYIAQEQEANRDHIQAYSYMTKYKTLASLRDRLTKVLEVKHPNYSVSALRRTRPQYLAYMMKEGERAFVASCSLETDQAQAVLLRDAFVENIKKNPPQRGYTVYQKMLDDIGNEHLDDPRGIAKKMLMWFHSQGKLIPDPNMLKRYVNTYRFGKDPVAHSERILDAIYEWN